MKRVPQSKHLKPKSRTSRSRLIENMEAAARRLARYANRAECELGEIGAATSLRGFASGLRDLADFMSERRMTLRPHLRRRAKSVRPDREQDSAGG